MGCSKRKGYMDHDYDYYERDDDKKGDKDYYKPPYGKHYENCVEDVLEGILEAQKKVKKDDCCKTSCQHSINDLLHEEKKSKKDTIPFILYCDCKPFKGSGVTKYRCHSKHSKLKCVETFVFKVKELDKKCAVLELLTFKDEQKNASKEKRLCSPCDQIDHKRVDDLIGTGICITVDLSCFCAISCLPAVRLDC
ncbi:CotY/CotZ family spore coat protein [Pontibacillus sp. HMF3514]|uniref:CotY/CotZ family spore coat protein n=1 Tax=Pontibacillus sp. HMF3514 TaxID=2692425 RepID=UPI00131F4E12|nr:CotY/CotZ family spore coat protein [Pontibacillus sp. HMF3514]QHE52626.1 spore coat protein [Pontibacillus sp. HMF3514]